MKKREEVLEGLKQQIPADVIHPADKARGIFGEYVTAQWSMQEANDIFGVDGIVGIEIVDDKVIELPVPDGPHGHWVFITTVKVTFIVDDNGVVTHFNRPGRGVGVAQSGARPVSPQQLDTAAKSALSDAIKNALMRTGQRLGAQLYFNERTAQALGYEIESQRAGSSAESDGAESEDDVLAELGAVVCKYGFGTADDEGVKPYTGWTIQKMWDDEGGRAVFDWAVEKEATGFFNERLRKFAALMETQGGGEPSGEADEVMVQIWTGEMKPADKRVDWAKMSTNPAFKEMLMGKFNPEEKIAHFNPNHKRMINHYKFHFGISSGHGMTWQMVDALYTYCKGKEGAAAFAYPEYYGEKDELSDDEVDALLEEEKPDDTSPHDTPQYVLGPSTNHQKLPTGLQVAAKEIGIEKPNIWLWDTMMVNTPVGDWKPEHTDLVLRILEAVKEGKVDYDSEVIGTMWKFGADAIEAG